MSSNKTPNLNLPQYKGYDKFDLKEINDAYNSIDNAYKEVIDFKNEIPKTNATAEVINARGGKETLGKRLDEFGSQLDNNTKLLYKEVTPEIFGAKGDGVTDDTQAIQNAIDFCNGGGKVKLPKIYRITDTLILKKGVVLEGFNDGLFSTLSRILVDIKDGRPAIKYDTVTTGIKMNDFLIKAFDESCRGKFNGIDFNGAEHIEGNNIFISHAKYGYYFSATNKANYLVKLKNISAINCDIGIFIPESKNWNNGLFIDIKELSDNRVGLQADGGSGNTINSNASEIGRNTECGIRINGGRYAINGLLWLEGSPSGIEVNNEAILCIESDLYNIKQIKKSKNARIIQNANQIYSNFINKKISLNKLSAWFSFDELSETITNYANGSAFVNTGYTTREEGIYGHSSLIKSNFGLDVLKNTFNPSQDWTLLTLVKNNTLTSGNGSVMLNIGSNDRAYSFYIDINRISNDKSCSRVRCNATDLSNKLPNGAFNLDHENSIIDDFGWIILKYDSTLKKMYSYTSSGCKVVANNEGNVSFDECGQGRNLYFQSKETVIYDEIIIFNRLLDNSEIELITKMSEMPSPSLKIKILEEKIKQLMNN